MEKINKNFSNFFANAAAAGYGTNEVVNFMKNIFTNPSSSSEKNRLKQGSEQGTLRPDEASALQTIHQSETPERLVKGAAKAIAGLGSAGFAATKLPGLIDKGIGI